MDRLIVYPGSIPLDTDVLSVQRNAMVALGAMAQAVLGTTTVVDGLACTQTTVASMSVLVGPGSLFALSTVDANAFGSLPADTGDALVKFGVNLTNTTLTMTAPVSAGQSINYLIEAAFLEADGTPVVLPYYNAANPASPYSGPAGGGAAQNTQRTQRVQLQLKAGTPATTGSQTTPAVDTGWVGLYVVTVAFAQTSITSGSIATLAAAPFIPFKLPKLTPGYSRVQVFAGSGTFTWPAGVTQAKVTVVGGGGEGGTTGSTASQAAAGGGAGGAAIKWITGVTPGTSTTVTVGAGGSGASAGSPGNNGGTSSFGAFCSATGGNGGSAATTGLSIGPFSGAGSGGDMNIRGGSGTDGQSIGVGVPGVGGNSIFGAGGRGGTISNDARMQGGAYGAGGGGAYSAANISGGQGAGGIVVVEY